MTPSSSADITDPGIEDTAPGELMPDTVSDVVPRLLENESDRLAESCTDDVAE